MLPVTSLLRWVNAPAHCKQAHHSEISPQFISLQKRRQMVKDRGFYSKRGWIFFSSSFVPYIVSYPWGPGVSFDSTVLPNKHAYKHSHKYTSIIKEPFLSPLPTKLINDYVFNTYIIHGRGRRRR